MTAENNRMMYAITSARLPNARSFLHFFPDMHGYGRGNYYGDDTSFSVLNTEYLDPLQILNVGNFGTAHNFALKHALSFMLTQGLTRETGLCRELQNLIDSVSNCRTEEESLKADEDERLRLEKEEAARIEVERQRANQQRMQEEFERQLAEARLETLRLEAEEVEWKRLADIAAQEEYGRLTNSWETWGYQLPIVEETPEESVRATINWGGVGNYPGYSRAWNDTAFLSPPWDPRYERTSHAVEPHEQATTATQVAPTGCTDPSGFSPDRNMCQRCRRNN